MPRDIRRKELVSQVSLDVLGLTLPLGSELKHALGDLYGGSLPLKGERRAGENFVENVAKHLYGGCVVRHEPSPNTLKKVHPEICVSGAPIFNLSTEISVGSYDATSMPQPYDGSIALPVARG